MKEFDKALVIGRFQPLHKGHIYLIKRALRIANKVIVGIGSANIHDIDNPFSVETRLNWIRQAIEKEKIAENAANIVSLDDDPSDEKWLQETLKKTGKIDVAVGNNEWVNGIFREAGYPVIEVPFYHREVFEGKKIRESLRAYE